jgi:hypothetical protein
MDEEIIWIENVQTLLWLVLVQQEVWFLFDLIGKKMMRIIFINKIVLGQNLHNDQTHTAKAKAS